MSGSSGSVVTDHTPWSSFCIARRPPTSRSTKTSLAFGARRRKVTLRSACTSGEMTGGGGDGGGAWASAGVAATTIKMRACFTLVGRISWFPPAGSPRLSHSRRHPVSVARLHVALVAPQLHLDPVPACALHALRLVTKDVAVAHRIGDLGEGSPQALGESAPQNRPP